MGMYKPDVRAMSMWRERQGIWRERQRISLTGYDWPEAGAAENQRVQNVSAAERQAQIEKSKEIDPR